MVRIEAQVISITPATWEPKGTPVVIVGIGTPVVSLESPENTHRNVMHLQLPGPQTRPLFDNRIQLVFSKEEWDGLEYKPTFGDNLIMESSKNGFKITKKPGE